MIGNVWEWVSTLYGSYPYDPHDGRENQSNTADYRVVRSGAWNSGLINLRAANRDLSHPNYAGDHIGFRCVRSIESLGVKKLSPPQAIPPTPIPVVPTCAAHPQGGFAMLYERDAALQQALGCAVGAAVAVGSAVEEFENGRMIWVSQFGEVRIRMVYVLYKSGAYGRFEDHWDQNADPVNPPGGEGAPTRLRQSVGGQSGGAGRCRLGARPGERYKRVDSAFRARRDGLRRSAWSNLHFHQKDRRRYMAR